jgi:hypothetical protein
MKTSFSHIRNIVIVLVTLLMIVSCEEINEWQGDSSLRKFVVVEGIITNESRFQNIKISESVSNLNEKPKNISGARVYVLEGSLIRNFYETPAGSGVYVSSEKFTGVINKQYSLFIRIGTQLYTAIARMIPVSPIPDLTFERNADSVQLKINAPAAVFDPEESNMYEILIDRSFAPQFVPNSTDSMQSLQYFYTLQTLDVNEIFAPKKEQVWFPKGSRIIVRKYSLTSRHAEFIRSLLCETEWRGGFFDTAQDNVRTNLSSGAFGFFAACSVLTDTIFAQ